MGVLLTSMILLAAVLQRRDAPLLALGLGVLVIVVSAIVLLLDMTTPLALNF